MTIFIKRILPKKIISIKGIHVDILTIAFTLYVLSQTLIEWRADLFLADKNHYLTAFIWLSSPVIFVYLLLRVIRIPALLCSYITLSLIVAFNFINGTKTALTGEPLSFNDIISGLNLTIAGRYLNYWSITSALLIILGGIILAYVSKNITTSKLHQLFLLLLLIAISPFAFTPYFLLLSGETKFNAKFQALSTKYNIVYASWNWPGNAQANGLPMHLIQTSLRKSVPSATDAGRALYATEKDRNPVPTTGHKTIIYILCESCWYDKNNFSEKFEPLFRMGYSALRATSPVYGGGTPNAEFEMLTGLPSNADKLSGIIYQEYAGLIKPDAETLASALKQKGFITYAAHNYIKNFWHRDVVYKKFGFDVFQGLSEMGDLPPEYASRKQPWQWQPDDYLLYRNAINAIKLADGKKIFLNLITMSTHGPFPHMNDYGEGVYGHELNESIERITEFSKEVEKIDPDAVIVIYGDHKPSLNTYFYKNKILPAEMFSKTGDRDEDFLLKNGATPKDYGDVPVLIKSRDRDSIAQLTAAANNKPFFCLSSLIDKYFIASGLPAFTYNANVVCDLQNQYSYQQLIHMPPAWLYAMALFED